MSQTDTDLAEVLEAALAEDDEKLFLECLQQGGSDRTQWCLVSDPSLFIRCCAKHFMAAVQQALQDCGHVINLSAQLEGRTALQWACLLGHVDVVTLLLSYVRPIDDVWRETSEFCSASLGGHMEVVKELTLKHAELVVSVDVRSALTYAACRGGNLEVVKFWVVPEMDINKPVELVSSLHDCENLIPLYAACEGNHRDVAHFLLESFGAEITEHIAEKFPELTASLVESVYSPLTLDYLDNEESEVRYSLRKAQVHVVHPLWLQPWLTTITHLDLRHNKLRQLPSCVPWALPNLIYINASHNHLTKLLPPPSGEEALCQRLEEVLLAHNQLTDVCGDLFQLTAMTSLDLSHNCLTRVGSQPSSPAASRAAVWQCSSLTTLNLSHNQLDLLNRSISGCSSLKKLLVSHNKLSSLPPPWVCNLERLDASHNSLERFPSSTEQFWRGSLTCLCLQNNCLDQLLESIVKLGMLEKLDMSNNHIEYLASPHVWDCPSLLDLNLGSNRLGVWQERVGQLEFPAQMLKDLRQLNLSDNQLTSLPISVCALRNLIHLDISNNPMRDLPQEMGNLTECWDLRLQGLDIRKGDLQEAVKKGKSQDVIEHLRNKLRKVQPCHVVKVLVLGPEGKGKSTIVKSLAEGSFSPVTVSDRHITRSCISLSKPREKFKIDGRKDSDRPELTLRVWELPGQAELMALHPVVMTENCFVLLVWDVTSGISNLDHWLCGLTARLARVSVILVATFRDRLPATSSEGVSHEDQFHREINQLYGHPDDKVGVYPKEDHWKIYPFLCSVLVVSFVTRKTFKQELSELKNTIYSSAIRRKGNRLGEFLVGQQLPLSYTALDKRLMDLAEEYEGEGRPPFLSQTEFDDLVDAMPESDFETFGDITDAVKMCCQTGSLLHFDVWPEGLGRLYFLSPDWLARMMATVLKPSGQEAPSKQAMRRVEEDLYGRGLPSNILRPFLQLLKHFDIGTPITEQGEERLLLPCHLPRQTPGLQLPEQQHGCRLLRFYALPHVPDRLWSRLILSLLLSVERFTSLTLQGSKTEKPRMVYWQKGLHITYSGGSVVIESCLFHSTEEKLDYPGILISILPDSAGISDLAIVGFVSAELDSAIQGIFPHHSDSIELFGNFALCPVCFDKVQPGQGVIRGDFRHFAVPECAGALLMGDFIRCHKGNYVPLEELVPEFLLMEMPREMHVDPSQLHVSGKKLGGGAAGSVWKGTLGGQEIAVKVFYSDVKPGDISPSTDSGTSSFSSNGSQMSTGYLPAASTDSRVYGNFAMVDEKLLCMRQDSIDGRNIKICQAFTELRQETVILSQLRHPCLVSLLAVSIRPSLLVALELAPLGSLRSVLKAEVEGRPFNKYLDRDKTFPSLLEKNVTFKVAYQVAVGLEYLHERKIVYRDLKSDNILVCSLDPNVTVNVKISDYGISKFATSQMTGMVGTPGYMAPEIMEGQAYDEKIDIFSFSMVLYEMLTGHAPFESCDRLHQIHNIINNEKQRPSLMEYNVIPCFPYLEDLMCEMWAHEASQRPSAKDVVRTMEDVAFLLQHSHITAAKDQGETEISAITASDSNLFCNVTCAWAYKESSSLQGRNTYWIWEYPSGFPLDRRLSIYNLASNQYYIHQKCCPGQQALCMAKVGSFVWVGVKDGGVEVFGSSCTDIPRRKAQWDDLGANPVAIVHDKHNPNKVLPEGEGLVYIGLSDGTIHIYHHYRWFRGVFTSEWKLWKKLTVSANSLSAMCLMPAHHELLVGCGHSLVIISTNTDGLLIERRICIEKDIPQRHRDKVTLVQNIVRNENSLWCSFEASPLIVEYDLHADVISGAYCIEADLEVDIWEVKLSSMIDRQLCKACGGFASGCDPGGRSSHRGMLVRPRESNSSPEPPPRPPKFRSPSAADEQQPAADQHKDNAGPKLTPRSPQTEPDSGAEASHSTVRNLSASLETPNLPKPPDAVAESVSLSREDIFSASGVDQRPPLLPPRRNRPVSERHNLDYPDKVPLNKKKSQTLPDLSRPRRPAPPPPSTPPRRSLPSEHEGVFVESILAVQDTLWVGSSCGEMLVIGARNHYKSADSACHRCSKRDSGAAEAEAAVDASGRTKIQVRMSLSLESKQICNLRSAGMNQDKRLLMTGREARVKSGGVQSMLQAHNLVVAVRSVSQETQARGIAEISAWEACTAGRITAIRHYWQSLETLKGQMGQ